MNRIAFVGKTSVTQSEKDCLSVLGMAIALAGDDLVTTPTGGAAAEVADGFRSAAGRGAILTNKPILKADRVIFYDDGYMLQALLERDPSPITAIWGLLTSEDRLRTFAEISLYILDEKGTAIS
jgi:hypothetical protein